MKMKTTLRLLLTPCSSGNALIIQHLINYLNSYQYLQKCIIRYEFRPWCDFKQAYTINIKGGDTQGNAPRTYWFRKPWKPARSGETGEIQFILFIQNYFIQFKILITTTIIKVHSSLSFSSNIDMLSFKKESNAIENV